MDVRGDQVMARWRKPWGQVERWHLVYGVSPAPLLNWREGEVEGRGEVIAGEIQDIQGILHANFSLKGVEGSLYLGVKGEGKDGKVGRVSNLVVARLESEVVTPTPQYCNIIGPLNPPFHRRLEGTM